MPGSSEYLRGGIVAYSNEIKESRWSGCDHELLVEHGAVSGEVALALADGARERLGATIGVGVTGVAGPGGGTAAKPVGTVWVAVSASAAGGASCATRCSAAARAEVRERTTTVALHLLRRLLLGEDDASSA